MRSRALRDGHVLDVLDRGHLSLMNLHLNLIRHPRSGIGPIVWSHKAAGRSGRQKRAAHARGRHSELAGSFTIHIDVDDRVIQRLVVLNVAERGNLTYLVTNLFGEGTVCPEIRSTHINFYRSGSTKIHDLCDDVPGLKRELTSGKFPGKNLSQALFELVHSNLRFRIQGYTQYSSILSARPWINCADLLRMLP